MLPIPNHKKLIPTFIYTMYYVIYSSIKKIINIVQEVNKVFYKSIDI